MVSEMFYGQTRFNMKTLKARNKLKPEFCYQLGVINLKGFARQVSKSIEERLKQKSSETQLTYEATVRTFGYLDSIEYWTHNKSLENHPEGWPKEMTIRDRLEQLTGNRFVIHDDLIKWWSANREYLFFSQQKGLLVIDQNRKLRLQPFPQARFEDNKNLKGFLAVRNTPVYSREWKTKDFIKYETIFPHKGFVAKKIDLELAQDREKIKIALIELVGSSISRMKDKMEKLKKDSLKNTMLWDFSRLERFVTKRYDKPEDWIEWFEKSKNKFSLSQDGSFLVEVEQ